MTKKKTSPEIKGLLAKREPSKAKQIAKAKSMKIAQRQSRNADRMQTPAPGTLSTRFRQIKLPEEGFLVLVPETASMPLALFNRPAVGCIASARTDRLLNIETTTGEYL